MVRWWTMRRWAFNIFAALSLAVCIAVLGLWTTTRHWPLSNRPPMGPGSGHAPELQYESAEGHLYLSLDRRQDPDPVPSVGSPALAEWARRHRPMQIRLPSLLIADWRSPVFTTYPGPPEYTVVERNRSQLWVAYWPLAVVTGILPLCWIAAWLPRHRRSRRRTKGLCPDCGYDLRASTSRCPECGLAVPADLIRKPIA